MHLCVIINLKIYINTCIYYTDKMQFYFCIPKINFYAPVLRSLRESSDKVPKTCRAICPSLIPPDLLFVSER